MQPHYLGPLFVISRNKGGADWPIATFQVIPYFARQKLNIPPLEELINISQKQLQELKDSKDQDPDEDDEAYGEDFKDYWGQ